MVAAGERSRAQPLGAELRALVRREARVQLTRLRTWLALGFAAAVPALITMAFAVGGPANATQGSPSANFLAVATRSGLDMPLASLDAMAPFLLVVLAAVFLGEPLAAEASWGNLRALLARPVRRGSLLAAKAVVGTALFVVSVVAAALSALATGVAAFGWHAVVTPEQTVFSPGVAAVRVAIAVGYTVLALASTGAVALFASTVTDSTIGSVATAIGFAVVSEVLDAIPTLGHVRGALPTHELLAWGNLFLVPAQLRPMGEGLLEQLPYVIAASLAAWRWFVSKDVLS
jgi:ABC-2 type transport system permease protein